jgi:hypothetical protein
MQVEVKKAFHLMNVLTFHLMNVLKGGATISGVTWNMLSTLRGA